MEIVAEGLGFPEGPVVMADGSVIVVEIEKSERFDGNRIVAQVLADEFLTPSK